MKNYICLVLPFTVLAAVISMSLAAAAALKEISTTNGTVATSNLTCGPGLCSEKEECVSWIKHCGSKKCDPAAYHEYHECFPKEDSDWTKFTPSEGKLCPENETHNIFEPAQPCLHDSPPCRLHWQYKCVSKEESAHSCSMKKCPEHNVCSQQIFCDLIPPCILQALCLPFQF